MASSHKSSLGAKQRLMQELSQLQKEKWVNIDVSALTETRSGRLRNPRC